MAASGTSPESTTQTSWISGIRPKRQYRPIISCADGGDPARTSSAVMPTSRRE
jgi:hypothetical protein